MPNIAVYIGTSVVSLLIENDGKLESVKIPFVYSKSAFSNQYSEPQFYKLLIEDVLKRRNLSLGSCKVSVCGMFESPEFSFSPEVSTNIVDVISSVASFTPIFCTLLSVITKDIISSYSMCSDVFENKDTPTCTFLSNVSLFPQLVPTEASVQADIDEDLCDKVSEDINIKDSQPVVFTGDRFSQNTVSKELDYILMLNLIKLPGIYSLFLDTNNNVILNSLRQNKSDIFSLVESVGTFISTKGPLECLLNTGVGTDQFFEVKKDSFFLMPLNTSSPASLSIKGAGIGNKKITVSGGDIGLVFDTREEKTSIYEDVKLFNNLSKDLTRILLNEK